MSWSAPERPWLPVDESSVLRLRWWRRRPPAPRWEPSPAVVEEEAVTRLYGTRTGTVSCSPASPPVPDDVAAA